MSALPKDDLNNMEFLGYINTDLFLPANVLKEKLSAKQLMEKPVVNQYPWGYSITSSNDGVIITIEHLEMKAVAEAMEQLNLACMCGVSPSTGLQKKAERMVRLMRQIFPQRRV